MTPATCCDGSNATAGRNSPRRDAQQHGKRRFPKADDIDPALAELTRRGYIRSAAGGSDRPRPAPVADLRSEPGGFTSREAESVPRIPAIRPANRKAAILGISERFGAIEISEALRAVSSDGDREPEVTLDTSAAINALRAVGMPA